MRLARLLLLPLVLLAAGNLARAEPGDVADSADHPAVTRYPGAVIKWHTIENYLPYRIAVGPVTGYRQITDWIDTEGRLTRIYYEVAGQKTHAEIYANYTKALEDGGLEILASGIETERNVGKNPGGRGWLEVYFAENVIQEQSGIVHLLQGSSTSGGSAFVAGKKARAAEREECGQGGEEPRARHRHDPRRRHRGESGGDRPHHHQCRGDGQGYRRARPRGPRRALLRP